MAAAEQVGQTEPGIERPLVCSVLVGRDAQVAALDRLIAEAGAGRDRLVLIAGEADIGKTRLVAATRSRAERLGFACLEGHCFEPDRSRPYAPLRDLLRTQFAAAPEDAAAPVSGVGLVS